MNQLLSVKNSLGHNIMPKGICDMFDKSSKASNDNDKASDFGKILKQQDQQKKSSSHAKTFASSKASAPTEERKLESQEGSPVKEVPRERTNDEAAVENIEFLVDENCKKVTDNFVISESPQWIEGNYSENFSEEAVVLAEGEIVEKPLENLAPLWGASDPVPDPLTYVVEDIPQNITTPHAFEASESNVELLPIADERSEGPESADAHLQVVGDEFVALEKTPSSMDVKSENVKVNPKAAKIAFHSQNPEIKKPILNLQTFESPQKTNPLLNVQYLDVLNNVGIKPASKEGERKGGFVSPLTTALIESENPLHPEATISSNGSRVAEILSQKNDTVLLSDSQQYFESGESTLPYAQPKVAVNTYEAVQKEHVENIQGMIATLEQQMDELKRSRRNSVIVKVDLENGESLNCQVTLARSDVAIRFPALEETFKIQILNHWEALRRFAQERQLNLTEPHFIAQTSL